MLVSSWKRWLSLVAAIALPLGCGGADAPRQAGTELGEAEQPAYYLSSSVWRTHSIPVCWEWPGFYHPEQDWVRQAVEETWSANANITFTGWAPCDSSYPSGIRISVSDTQPHTRGLGSQMNGLSGGMVLNFFFQSWNPWCQSNREFCIRATAVHEFGHALSFAHEQNRPDTPSSCADAPSGTYGDTIVGAWDLSSVMNYCNPSWDNNGQLSPTDITAVRQLYGRRQTLTLSNLWCEYEGALSAGTRTFNCYYSVSGVSGSLTSTWDITNEGWTYQDTTYDTTYHGSCTANTLVSVHVAATDTAGNFGEASTSYFCPSTPL